MKKNLKVKLTKVKKQVSKNWKQYQKSKTKINKIKGLDYFKKQRLIDEELKQTKLKNQYEFNEYKIYKNNNEENIIELKRYNINNGYIKTYLLNEPNEESLQSEMFKCLELENLRYIIVTMSFIDNDTGRIVHLSESFTPLDLNFILIAMSKGAYVILDSEEIEEFEINSIYELMFNKFNTSGNVSSDTTNLSLQQIFIKLIFNESSSES